MNGMRCGTLCGQGAALVVLAGLGALLANSWAGPHRRLAWAGRPQRLDTLPLAEGVPESPAAPAPQPVPEAPRAAPAPSVQPHPEPAAAPARNLGPDPDPERPVREIDGATALDLHRGGVPFLDARRASVFAEGHVRGAWNLPVWEAALEEAIIRFEAAAKPQGRQALVLYCDGGDCEDSHLLARTLFQLGYRNLLIYRDGFLDWVRRGGATDREARP